MSDKKLEKQLDKYLDSESIEKCEGDECVIKSDKSIVERINKKVITEDGRELLT